MALMDNLLEVFAAQGSDFNKTLKSYDYYIGNAVPVDTVAIHSGILYRCITAHTAGETFDASKWVQTISGGEGSGHIIQDNGASLAARSNLNFTGFATVEDDAQNNATKVIVSVDKNSIGLGNVTNDAQVKRSEMGAASGVATLDEDGKLVQAQSPYPNFIFGTRAERMAITTSDRPLAYYQTDQAKGWYGFVHDSGSSGAGKWTILGRQGVPLTASANQATGVVTLTWSLYSEYIAYNIYRDSVFLTTVSGSTTTYTYTEAGGNHSYTVEGVVNLNAQNISVTLPSLLTPTKVRLVQALKDMTSTSQLDSASDSNAYYSNYSDLGYNQTEAWRINVLTNNSPTSAQMLAVYPSGSQFLVDLGAAYQVIKICALPPCGSEPGGWNYSYHDRMRISYWNGSGWVLIPNTTPALPYTATSAAEWTITFPAINARYFMLHSDSNYTAFKRCRFYAFT